MFVRKGSWKSSRLANICFLVKIPRKAGLRVFISLYRFLIFEQLGVLPPVLLDKDSLLQESRNSVAYAEILSNRNVYEVYFGIFRHVYSDHRVKIGRSIESNFSRRLKQCQIQPC